MRMLAFVVPLAVSACATAPPPATPIPLDDTRWHRRMTAIADSVDALAGIEAWIGTQAERSGHRFEWR